MEVTPRSRLLWLVLGLLPLGIVLFVTIVPGVFTIDENNYTATVRALRAGGLMVPGTQGVTPSLELAAFDPISRYRQPVSPVSSSVPPLYAFLATPFSFLGWKGLFLVNIVAFLASTVAVFAAAGAVSGRRETPWIAAGLFLLGGYGVEYAQGVWPHMLSATIAATGFFLACRARRDDSALKAALAGFLTGLAVGIRYQNIVFAFAVGLGLLLLSRARLRLAPAFALGVALPILACSFLNHERLGTWNPISKGKGYLTTGLTRPVSRILLEAPSVLYVKVLDFSAHPPLSDPVLEIQAFWRPDPRTGVLVFFGAIKKAWVQSSPWILLGLVALIFAWLPGMVHPARDDLRAAGLVVACVLGAFAIAGIERHDGVCFNQRYFLELVPLLAVVVALAVEKGLPAPAAVGTAARAAALAGAGTVVFVVGLLRLRPDSLVRQYTTMGLPVLLAGGLVLFWFLRRDARPDASATRGGGALVVALSASLAWAAAIHLGEDVPAARLARGEKLRIFEYGRRLLPAEGPVALIAYRGATEAFGPLQLERDLVILDAWADRGLTTATLTDEYLAKGRRVFLLANGFPAEIGQPLLSRFDGRLVAREAAQFVELTRRQAP